MFCFVLSLVQWQIVDIKTSFMHTLGKGKEQFISPERGMGRGLNCTGAKYERILLLEYRMEKNNVTFSAVLFFFHFSFLFDAQ